MTPISSMSAEHGSEKLSIPFTKIGGGGGLIEFAGLEVSEVQC